MNIAYMVGCGLGNQIQTIPVYLALKEKYSNDLIWVINSWAIEDDPRQIYTDLLFENVFCPYKNNVKLSIGKTYASMFGHSKQVTKECPRIKEESEIKFNFRRAEIELPKFPYNWSYELPFSATWITESPELVIACDVGIEPTTGKRPEKGYQHWKGLIGSIINDLNIIPTIVGDLSLPKGKPWSLCEDKTNLTLLETIQLIENASLFIGNDSGLYHAANMVNTKNIVLFCGRTSMEKNYDLDFYSHCIALDRPDILEVNSSIQKQLEL